MSIAAETAAERLATLCTDFRLPTLAEQLVPRLVDAGHGALLPLVADIFELEAGDRRERRVDRLRRASRLPPGKTLATGRSVLWAPAFSLVQDLLAAKRDLALPRALAKLDLFELVILDDIGYVQQSPDEIEVLFTLLAERYERRSLLITSNLVFSEWSQIFRIRSTDHVVTRPRSRAISVAHGAREPRGLGEASHPLAR